jgi:hypothetical protein
VACVQWRDVIRQFGVCGVAKQKIPVLLLHEERGIIYGIGTRASMIRRERGVVDDRRAADTRLYILGYNPLAHAKTEKQDKQESGKFVHKFLSEGWRDSQSEGRSRLCHRLLIS